LCEQICWHGSLCLKMLFHCKNSLAAGQVWRTRVADIEILRLGKRLIHYRITKQLGHRRVSSQLSGIDALANYLRANEARLAKRLSKNPDEVKFVRA
jgi:hypothetical protein